MRPMQLSTCVSTCSGLISFRKRQFLCMPIIHYITMKPKTSRVYTIFQGLLNSLVRFATACCPRSRKRSPRRRRSANERRWLGSKTRHSFQKAPNYSLPPDTKQPQAPKHQIWPEDIGSLGYEVCDIRGVGGVQCVREGITSTP